MTQGFAEETVELAGIEALRNLGWMYLHGSVIAPDGASAQRASYSEAVLLKRLEMVVERINPDLPEVARSEAIRQILIAESANLVEENRRIHRLITDGVDVEYRAGNGRIQGAK